MGGFELCTAKSPSAKRAAKRSGASPIFASLDAPLTCSCPAFGKSFEESQAWQGAHCEARGRPQGQLAIHPPVCVVRVVHAETCPASAFFWRSPRQGRSPYVHHSCLSVCLSVCLIVANIHNFPCTCPLAPNFWAWSNGTFMRVCAKFGGLIRWGCGGLTSQR